MGDILKYNGKEQEIISINKVNKIGKYSPLTSSGLIEVNGVLSSCFCNFENQYLNQLWF